MPNVFFTADTHFGHNNIIKYCKRPFVDHIEMDEAIITRFNEVLRPGDVLWHLGDVSFSTFNKKEGFLDRLKTKEVHLVFGNHDHPKDFKHLPFRSMQDLRGLTLDKHYVILSHYPMRSWNGRGHGAFQLYGHVHNMMPGIGRQMDVGVDTHNFYPWAWEEIKEKLKDIEYKVYD